MIITFGARDGSLDLGDTDFVVGRQLGVAEYGKREGFFVDSNCVTLVGTKEGFLLGLSDDGPTVGSDEGWRLLDGLVVGDVYGSLVRPTGNFAGPSDDGSLVGLRDDGTTVGSDEG